MIQTNRVAQMQQQGMSDGDIINALKNEGVSLKDISDSLAQAKIKMAVSQEEQYPANPSQQEQQYSQQGQQQYAPEQQYQYPEQNQMGIETMTEIVDRIIAEKLKEINQKIKPVVDFKNKAEEDMTDIKERLKRIESTMDSLQKAVIGKVGEFGQSTSMIHQDLENLHGTVSKLMNPLIDNYNELKKTNASRR